MFSAHSCALQKLLPLLTDDRRLLGLSTACWAHIVAITHCSKTLAVLRACLTASRILSTSPLCGYCTDSVVNHWDSSAEVAPKASNCLLAAPSPSPTPGPAALVHSMGLAAEGLSQSASCTPCTSCSLWSDSP